MQAISTSPFNLSTLRKYNIWYTIKDGNWSDPTIWMGNGKRKHNVPQVGDDVYVNDNVTMDTNIHVNNLYISGTLKGTSLLGVSITIDGDCQVTGSGLIDLSLQYNNLILNGYNNIIPPAGFVGGSYSTVTYNAPNYQTLLNLPYNNLTTQNGFKYQSCDIIIGGNFNQQSNYDCGVYDLTVNGSSTIGTVGYCSFYKTGTGNLLFVGAVDFEGNVNLSGNPDIEFRNGFTIHTYSLISGSGTVTFTTNSQTINCSAYLGGTWNANIIIQGAITVTLIGGSAFQVNNTINGTVSTSTFNNSGVLYLGYNSTPMSTGIFNHQYTSTSTLGYVFNGAYTLPYSTYSGLFIAGTGTKTLSANTTVGQAFSNNGYLECNGFDLTVTGVFSNAGGLSTNAFCNLLFENAASFTVYSGSFGVDFRTGNPNVEFRNGLEVHTQQCYTGSGTFTFSTNNQTLNFSAFNGGACNCNILISGAISLLFLGNATTAGTITGVVNGDNTSSTFNNGGTFQYNNSQQPMQTGLLLCNQVTNTFIYGATINQDIKLPSDSIPGYQNLTLNGSGVKRLLSNVSVKGIYSLISPATLNSNGFVLTNP